MACKVCSSTNLAYSYEQACFFCSACGILLSKNEIDPKKDWRSFGTNPSSRERASSSKKFGFQETYTEIESEYVTGEFKEKKTLLKAKKLKKWYKRTKFEDFEDKSLNLLVVFINSFIQKKLISSDLKDQIIQFYLSLKVKDIFKGRNLKNLLIATILYFYRKKNYPFSFKEFCISFEISKKNLGRAYRYLKTSLDLKLEKKEIFEKLIPFVELTLITEEDVTKIKTIFKTLSEREDLSQKGEYSLLFAIFFLYLEKQGKTLQQRELKFLEVSFSTIKSRIKEIREYFLELF